ncbi:NADP-dependent oxidoreductase domain-containing protein [Fusarium avenaceum]|nr:NADP-dependent oxidoreductase domain-containing protein [Fusarium avenaceum]
MAVTNNGSGNTAHVNMMTDTVIANLPAEGLRVIVRSLLTAHPEITTTFEHETRQYLGQVGEKLSKAQADAPDINGLKQTQKTIRCMLGSGLPFESIQLLSKVVTSGAQLALNSFQEDKGTLGMFLASLDGDIVQAMTAVKKTLFVDIGARALTSGERGLIRHLFDSLTECQDLLSSTDIEFPYARGLLTTGKLLGIALPNLQQTSSSSISLDMNPPRKAKETFQLGGRTLPRLFSGLWQMSSPAWGAAPTSKIIAGFSTHVQNGFTAFDMADHYGDAEVIYGSFRRLYPHRDEMFTATKYCIFHHMTVSPEAVKANITERCERLQQDVIDLLQFHWQFWEDPQYIDALRYLSLDERVARIGLCNFNTEHLHRVLQSGIEIHTNQVQFSLIDSRPTVKMGDLCSSHNIKLLTYGTLCGGFLADKWLGKPEPDVYDSNSTPSQRKYYTMICSWGGWGLFQELLGALRTVATKHQVNISNVATRWVLDFPYVGAVIIGARFGMSEHTNDNAATLGWSLDDNDRLLIERVLSQSRRDDMFQRMGDCGNEYR